MDRPLVQIYITTTAPVNEVFLFDLCSLLMFVRNAVSADEVTILLGIFALLENGNGKMDRSNFRLMLQKSFNMTDDMLMDGVLRVMKTKNEGLLSEEEFMSGMSIFLRGSLEEKIKFCFEVYDLWDTKFISRENMFLLLKQTIAKPQNEEDRDESIKDLIDLVLKKVDVAP